jgi:hypothetical protein
MDSYLKQIVENNSSTLTQKTKDDMNLLISNLSKVADKLRETSLIE